MNDMNIVLLTGVLAESANGAVPVSVACTQSGRRVATFRLKVSRTYKERDYTMFVTVKHWGDAIDSLMRTAPGAGLLVTGRLDIEAWEGQNGQRRYETVVTADTVGGYVPPTATAQQPQQQPRGNAWSSQNPYNNMAPQAVQQPQQQYGAAPQQLAPVDDTPF